jgi:hypothetical protein
LFKALRICEAAMLVEVFSNACVIDDMSVLSILVDQRSVVLELSKAIVRARAWSCGALAVVPPPGQFSLL